MKKLPWPTIAIAILVLVCLVSGYSLFQKAMARSEAIVLVKEQAATPEYLREWVKEQEAIGPVEVKGWDVTEGDREGTFIVSFTVERKAAADCEPGIDGFWFRVNCETETIEPVQPRGSGY